MNYPQAPFRRYSNHGLFITFEGPEGAGKSLQARRLISRLRREGYAVNAVRDPGSTRLGRALRRVLLHEPDPLSPLTEALLFFAGRIRLVEECILPALNAGHIVVCDRFHDATVAYQGFGGQLSAEWLDEFGRAAIGEVMPDMSFLLDLKPEEGMARLNRAKDRMERKQLTFHRKVREGYLTIAKQNTDRFHCLDATRSPRELSRDIFELIKPKLRGIKRD